MPVSIYGDGSISGVSTLSTPLGVVTATTFSGDLTGNVSSSGVSTISQLNVGTGGTVITTTAGGLVGLGTDNPQRELDVFGPSTDGTNLILRTSGSNSAGLKMVPGPSGNEYEIQAVSSAAGTNPNSFIVYDRTNSSYRMVIDSSGRVTTPSQPRFFAYSTATQAINATGTYHATLWNATRFNVGNHFDTSTDLFVAPIAGCYLFGTQVRFESTDTGYFRLIISINNSTLPSTQAHSIKQTEGPNYHTMAVTALYELSALDNVRVLCESASDTSWSLYSESQFWGMLIA